MVWSRHSVVLNDGARLDDVLCEALTALGGRTAREARTEKEFGDRNRRNTDVPRVLDVTEIETAALYLDEHAGVE